MGRSKYCEPSSKVDRQRGSPQRGVATAPATSVWELTQPSLRPETVSQPSSSLGTALPGAASKAGEQSSLLRSTHTPLDRVKPPHGESAAQSAWHDAADGSLDNAVRAAAAGSTLSHSPRRSASAVARTSIAYDCAHAFGP